MGVVDRQFNHVKENDTYVEYEAVRKDNIVALRITADLLSYYAIKTLDKYIGEKDTTADKAKRISMIYDVVRGTMVFIWGRNDGTQINQMSQRLTNMICRAYSDTAPEFTRSTAVVIKDEQIAALERSLSWNTRDPMGPTINVKVSKDDGGLMNSILQDVASENGVDGSVQPGSRIPIYTLAKWIVRSYLLPAQTTIKYSSISKRTNDIIRSVTAGLPKEFPKNCPKTFVEDVIRMGIALRCVIYGTPMGRIGETYELVFSLSGLSLLLPPIYMDVPPAPIRSVAVMGPPGAGKTTFSSSMSDGGFNILDCEGTIGPWDTGLQLHNVHIVWGYDKTPFCIAILLDSKYPRMEQWISSFKDSVKNCSTYPNAIIAVSDSEDVLQQVQRALEDVTVVLADRSDAHMVLDDRVRKAVRSVCDIHMDIDSSEIESMLFSTVKDVLMLGYPDIAGSYESNRMLRSSGQYPGNIGFINELIKCTSNARDISTRDDVLDSALAASVKIKIEDLVKILSYLGD